MRSTFLHSDTEQIVQQDLKDHRGQHQWSVKVKNQRVRKSAKTEEADRKPKRHVIMKTEEVNNQRGRQQCPAIGTCIRAYWTLLRTA